MNQNVLKSTQATTLGQRINKVGMELNGHLAGNSTDADYELIRLFANRVHAIRSILQSGSPTHGDFESYPDQESLVADIEEDTKALYAVLPFPPEYLVTMRS